MIDSQSNGTETTQSQYRQQQSLQRRVAQRSSLEVAQAVLKEQVREYKDRVSVNPITGRVKLYR